MYSAIAFVVLFQFAMAADLQVRVTAAGSREPLPTVFVRLLKLGVPIQEASALDGKTQFSNLAPGRYTVVAAAPGYETRYSDVILPEEFLVFIDLRPQQASGPAGSQAPSSGSTVRRFFRKLFS